MKITPKLFAILALLTLSIAASAAQPEATYRFEIRMADHPEALTVRAKSGETQTVKTTGNSSEYTSSETTMPMSSWQGMVKAGTAPDHDFVTCAKKTCTYGMKAKIVDYVNISLRPMEQDGGLVVAVAYDSSQSKSTAVAGGMRVPEVAQFHSGSSLVMKAGDMLPIADSNGVVAVVKFVGAE